MTLKTKNQIQFIYLILVQSSFATATKFYSFILLFWVRWRNSSIEKCRKEYGINTIETEREKLQSQSNAKQLSFEFCSALSNACTAISTSRRVMWLAVVEPEAETRTQSAKRPAWRNKKANSHAVIDTYTHTHTHRRTIRPRQLQIQIQIARRL